MKCPKMSCLGEHYISIKGCVILEATRSPKCTRWCLRQCLKSHGAGRGAHVSRAEVTIGLFEFRERLKGNGIQGRYADIGSLRCILS